jgi:hypothetical protein
MRKGVKSAVKIEINLSLDEFKRLLANGAGFKDLLATNIKEPVTKTVEKDGGSKSDEPLVEKPEPRVEVTMETVRAKLAALMQGGKQAEVKELLKKHGGDKLSDVPKENYPALLTEAEGM